LEHGDVNEMQSILEMC
jgi:hypothetical protein